MWTDLPQKQKDEYKKMILAFASLTEIFAQKADNDVLLPIINSKYQETIFQRVFNASAEDIGNTSYDVALQGNYGNRMMKYLIGIKTFGIDSEAQKVAQFKANINDWSDILNSIRVNSVDENGSPLPKDEVNTRNSDLYLELATFIADLRNERIESSKANLQGFRIESGDNIESIYHVLMPSKEDDTPSICVGEIEYSKIDIDNIEILGCTSNKNPQNFNFTDGKHRYKFTAADSQLYMYFNNRDIIQDTWNVKYVDDAYSIFRSIADGSFEEKKQDNNAIKESYSWKITNSDGEVERYSGWNAFFGLGSKLSKNSRMTAINNAISEFEILIPDSKLSKIKKLLIDYLMNTATSKEERVQKELIREQIMNIVRETGDESFKKKISSLVYRPVNEMYIPFPNSRNFHNEHPDFFGKNIGTFQKNAPQKLALPQEDRQFNLVFEPSGDIIRAFITEDNGKAIESTEKQTKLGEWILKGIFQLPDYEPLTAKRLTEMEINGIRIYKISGSDDVHLQFIWIDDDDLPDDYIGK